VSIRRFLSGAALTAVALLAVTGCKSEYDRTVITAGSRPSPFPGHVTEQGILVTNGMVTTAHIVSYNDDDNIMTMNVRAVDPTVLDVSNVISDHDFAFVGLKVGTTDVEIRADDKVVLIIAATVAAQPPP
jgi:hypothetical protein